MSPEIIVVFIFAIAMFIQTSAGFGSALIAMGFLLNLFGHAIAAPLFALSYSSFAIVITLRYRKDLKFKNIWRMLIAGLLSIPIGVGLLTQLPESLTLTIFAIFIIGYAIYALVGFRIPPLSHTGWQWGLGALAGMISGAYNTSGPVYVIYADSQRWQPFEFKGNLQVLFFLNSLTTTTNHFLFGNITETVLQLWVFAVPGMMIGIGMGFFMDRFIQPGPFRKVILVLLLLIGFNILRQALTGA